MSIVLRRRVLISQKKHPADAAEFSNPIAAQKIGRRPTGAGADAVQSRPLSEGLRPELMKFLGGDDRMGVEAILLDNLLGKRNIFIGAGGAVLHIYPALGNPLFLQIRFHNRGFRLYLISTLTAGNDTYRLFVLFEILYRRIQSVTQHGTGTIAAKRGPQNNDCSVFRRRCVGLGGCRPGRFGPDGAIHDFPGYGYHHGILFRR